MEKLTAKCKLKSEIPVKCSMGIGSKMKNAMEDDKNHCKMEILMDIFKTIRLVKIGKRCFQTCNAVKLPPFAPFNDTDIEILLQTGFYQNYKLFE